jgi:predicted nucleotidyltransferase
MLVMVAMNDIQAVVDRIAEEYDPDRVVLFGSHARGTAASESDVDLLARRPDDTQRRYAQGDPLIREALDQGRALHERSHR